MDPRDPASLPLRDIHLPPSIGWWPPAPGWWAVLIAGGLLAASFAFWLRRHRALTLRVRVMDEIDAIETRYRHTEDRAHLVQDLSALLRRIALSRSPRTEVASLNGAAWLEFLQSKLDDPRLLGGLGTLLAVGPYRVPVEFEIDELLTAVRGWAVQLTTPGPA